MKKLFIVLCVLLTLVGFISCETQTETATLRVEMKNSRRTIQPGEDNLEIYGYKIVTVSPDGKESEPYYTYYSYLNLEGLNVGKWSIKVYGFNSDRKDIVYGEGEISLIAGKNTIAISLDELVGEGDLSVLLDWSESGVDGVTTIDTVFKSQDGKEIILSPSSPVNSQSTISQLNLPAGSYTLQVSLLDKEGKKLLGLAEAVRISNGAVSKTTLKFLGTTGDESGSADITISDKTSVPVEVRIVGVESLIEADKPFTVAISVPSDSAITEKSLNSIWYLDGEKVGEGNEFTFQNGVSAGSHRIDVTTSTGEEGSVGSQSVQFQAAVSTNTGDPYQKITIQNGSDFALGSDTIIRILPNNYLLSASNQYRRMQLISVSTASAKVVADYTYDQLKIGDYKVADFITSGSKNEQYYSVIVLCNSTSTCKAVNLMVSKTQISYCDEETDFDSDGGADRACRFVNITEAKGVYVATLENIGKTRLGYMSFNIRPAVGKMVCRIFRCAQEPTMNYGYSGFKAMSSLPDTGFVIITAGQRSRAMECYYDKMYNSSSITEYNMWLSYDDYMKYYEEGQVKDEFRDGYDCGFLTNDGIFAFVLSSEGIYYFKLDTDSTDDYEIYNVEKIEKEGTIGAITMCDDVSFGYLIDNSEKKLYTVTPTIRDDEYCYLERGTSIALDSTAYNALEVSDDGTYLVVYNHDNCAKANIIKVAR